jgi:hypothetical protein
MGFHAVCAGKLRAFEEEIEEVIKLQWPGCSYDIVSTASSNVPADAGADADAVISEGVPPGWEPEPEAEPGQ